MDQQRSILLAVDGSTNAERATRHAIELVKSGYATGLHLLNVQAPVSGAVTTFVSRAQITDYQREEGEKGMAGAKRLCGEAGVAYEPHIGVGRAGIVVAEFCKRLGCSMIVIGTRGHTGFSGALMGSVAQEVVAQASVPICLVK